MADLPVDHGLVDQALADSGRQGGAEPGGGPRHLEVEARQRGGRGGVCAEPVRHDEPVEAPLAAEDPVDEVGLLAAVDAVDLVVGGHHGPDAGLPYGGFEGGEVDLPQGALGDLGADRHPLVLLVVAGEVLDAAPDPAPLHPLHVGDGEAGRQQRVLGERLEGAPGQRRAHDADRRPQQHVDALGPGLGGQDLAEARHERWVPRRPDRHAAGQRQRAAADQAVTPDARRAVGDLERRDAEPLDRREVPQVGPGGEGALLVEGHGPDEVLDDSAAVAPSAAVAAARRRRAPPLTTCPRRAAAVVRPSSRREVPPRPGRARSAPGCRPGRSRRRSRSGRPR